MTKPLTPQQQLTLDRARGLPPGDASLVRGHAYRTATSLERLGYGTLTYQGPSLGWFLPFSGSANR